MAPTAVPHPGFDYSANAPNDSSWLPPSWMAGDQIAAHDAEDFQPNGGDVTDHVQKRERVSGQTPENLRVRDARLKMPKYDIKGTEPNSKILIKDVKILDSTGREPYPGDVFVRGERIIAVGNVEGEDTIGARTINGRGRTLMSGLCDGHTHFSWTNSAHLDALGDMPVEEHLLFSMRSAKTYLDSGYTMCLGAASAKQRLDVVLRDAINEGEIPGPRYLANGQEMAPRDGALIASITAFADGVDEMRKVVDFHNATGVDQIKLSMSGEEITVRLRAEDTTFKDDEVKACVDAAHAHGLRVCSHARSTESIKQCLNYGVDIIYHASFIDDEGMEMLEQQKDRVWVAPGLNWIICTLENAASFGYPPTKAESVGYKRELTVAVAGLREMKKRGVKILPGGDYGFAWTPHGTYARDLDHFVKLLGYTPMEAIIAATATGGDIMMRPDELGKVQPGYYADMILVNGNPLEDITILQDHSKLDLVMINGRIHKETLKDSVLLQHNPSLAEQIAQLRIDDHKAVAPHKQPQRTEVPVAMDC